MWKNLFFFFLTNEHRLRNPKNFKCILLSLPGRFKCSFIYTWWLSGWNIHVRVVVWKFKVDGYFDKIQQSTLWTVYALLSMLTVLFAHLTYPKNILSNFLYVCHKITANHVQGGLKVVTDIILFILILMVCLPHFRLHIPWIHTVDHSTKNGCHLSFRYSFYRTGTLAFSI